MKIICNILLVLLVVVPHTWGADPISIEEFKEIANADKRQEIIDQAPLGQKEELRKIDIHLSLLARWHGETGLKTHKETCIARARGFICLESIFDAYVTLWSAYIGGILTANEKAGMKLEQRQEVEKKLTEEEDVVKKRISNVHSIVFNLAASPEALDLEKRVEKMVDKPGNRTMKDGSTPYRPITKEERMEADKQMGQIYKEIKKLPKLTSEQAQKEYDAFPDEKVR